MSLNKEKHMPIKPPPIKKEDEIHAIANKGAPSTPINEINSQDGFKNITIRVSLNVLDRIDAAKNKQLGYTRTNWILQAIQKALEE